jgi:hypothetical protein
MAVLAVGPLALETRGRNRRCLGGATMAATDRMAILAILRVVLALPSSRMVGLRLRESLELPLAIGALARLAERVAWRASAAEPRRVPPPGHPTE